MATIIQTTHSVCTAHRLMNHQGACKYLHGHNYNVTVYVTTNELKEGMVVDFSVLKKEVREFLDRYFDHRCVLERGDPLIDILRDQANQPVTEMSKAPTAENMAALIKKELSQVLIEHGVRTVRIDVEETANNKAILQGD